MEEEWRQISGYEGLYEVSNLGNVRSYHNFGNGLRTKPKPVKPSIDRYGYQFLTLCKDTKHKKYTVHKLVASAFLENPNELPQIDHVNGIKTDNRAENLEYVSARENTIRSVFLGLKPHGEKHKLHKLSQKNVDDIRELYSSGKYSQRKLSEMFGVSGCTIGRILRNETWRELRCSRLNLL